MAREKVVRVVLLVTLMLATAGKVWPANAAPILWYNGDPVHPGGDLSNERNTLVSQSSVYDNFVVPESAGSWIVHGIFSINMMDIPVLLADWSIRSGVSAGYGGAVIASGISPVTQTLTGFTADACGPAFHPLVCAEYVLEVDGLNVTLAPGTYWLNVTPVGSGFGRSLIERTSGENAVGTPLGDDNNSFWDSTTYGQDFSLTTISVGTGFHDFSQGVRGFVQTSPDLGRCGPTLKGCNLSEANLSNLSLAGANLKGTNLKSANVTGVDLTGANLAGSNLNGADLEGAYLQGANLKGANLKGANLSNANLNGAQVKGVNLNRVTWSNTVCPDGTNSDSDGGTCVGH